MIKKFGIIIILVFVFSVICSGQETDSGPGYQMIMMNNPSFAGSEGEVLLRLSYLNYYPGNNYNLHSVYVSYDSYFSSLHGGAGIYISDDYQGGIINDIRGGLSYSYFIQAGKDIFINAGLSGSFYHRGFSFGNALFPDQIDPLAGIMYPTSEALASKGRTVFDIRCRIPFYSREILYSEYQLIIWLNLILQEQVLPQTG